MNDGSTKQSRDPVINDTRALWQDPRPRLDRLDRQNHTYLSSRFWLILMLNVVRVIGRYMYM